MIVAPLTAAAPAAPGGDTAATMAGDGSNQQKLCSAPFAFVFSLGIFQDHSRPPQADKAAS
jgi:hypothetical protein